MDPSLVRERLLDKQRELHGRLESTQATERQEVEDGSNDGAQLWEVSETRDALDDEAAAELDQVNEALARLEAGEYGRCRSCDTAIAEARLEALPYATLCIDCAERAE